MKEKKNKKQALKKSRQDSKNQPDDRIELVKEDQKEDSPQIFKIIKRNNNNTIERREFLKQASKIAGLGGIAALSGILSNCKKIAIDNPICSCDHQGAASKENACTCHNHQAVCTCNIVQPCTCDIVCTCNLVGDFKEEWGSNYNEGICTCDTVCSCNRNRVCTCNNHCTCDTVCTCDDVCTCDGVCSCNNQGHYWYPN
jgi:hypothetical protein